MLGSARRGGRRPFDLAIAGTRGVPARYSGFETFAEELGSRLVERGHRVTVYGRVPYVGSERREHMGMQVVPVRSPRGKHLETPLHTIATALKAARAQHDLVLVCNAANAFALPLFRLSGARTLINVDGVDRMRRKWGRLGRLWFLLGEQLSLWLASQPVVDASFLQDYYQQRYGRALPMIPYGGDREPEGRLDREALAAFGLEQGRYVLVVGRLEPENNALLVAEAYRRVGGDLPLVIVGDAPYADAYKAKLRAAAGPRVRLLGGVYGDRYLALQGGAACYVAAGEVGGTHPALVEAMALGAPIVANDVPEHREVLGDAGLYYRPGSEAELAGRIEQVLSSPEVAAGLRRKARARAAERYRWDDVVDQYEELLYRLLPGGAPR